MHLRPAAAADASAIHEIYDHYAKTTAITFAEEAPSAAHYAAQMDDRRYPFFVAEEDGRVAGFGYAAAFRAKEAYRWDAELTIYLAPGYGGRGAGSALMGRLLDVLTAQGYRNAYSCVTLPNEASLGMHRHYGFSELGIFPRTGYKLGKWHDVIWLGKALGDADAQPREPLSADEI